MMLESLSCKLSRWFNNNDNNNDEMTVIVSDVVVVVVVVVDDLSFHYQPVTRVLDVDSTRNW